MGAAWTDRTFRVMGTRARVLAQGVGDAAVDAVVGALHRREARWTRFDPASELMRLNERAGTPVVVGAELYDLVERAVVASRRTDGWFDPTGLAAIRALGYDRDFDAIATAPGAPAGPPRPLPGVDGIVLDPLVRSVLLPVGVALDLGGIGKGHAADLAVGELLAAGATAVCVDLGGDVRVAGAGPYDGAWLVETSVAPLAERGVRFRLAAGAVATSTVRRRRWPTAEGDAHHLLDPRTGRSARSGLAAVSVVAATAADAEVFAKAALVAGPGTGSDLVTRHGLAAVVVTDDDEVRTTAGATDYVVGLTSAAGTRSS